MSGDLAFSSSWVTGADSEAGDLQPAPGVAHDLLDGIDPPPQRLLKLWSVGCLMAARALRTQTLMHTVSASLRTQASLVESRVIATAVASAMRSAAAVIEDEQLMHGISETVAEAAQKASTADAAQAVESGYRRAMTAAGIVLQEPSIRQIANDALDLAVFVAENEQLQRIVDESCRAADVARRVALQSWLGRRIVHSELHLRGTEMLVSASRSSLLKKLAPYPMHWLHSAAQSETVRAAGGLLSRLAKSRTVKAMGTGGLALVDAAMHSTAASMQKGSSSALRGEELSTKTPEASPQMKAVARAISGRVGRGVGTHELLQLHCPQVRTALVDECAHLQSTVVELQTQLAQQRAKSAVVDCCELVAERAERAGLEHDVVCELKQHVWTVLMASWMLVMATLGVLWMVANSIATASRNRVMHLRRTAIQEEAPEEAPEESPKAKES